MRKFFVASGFILLSQSAGLIGSFFTFSAIPTWYAALAKPFFTPPNWVFGPVWILLYCLIGFAAYLIYQKGWKKKQVKKALSLFFIQLALNAWWTIIFFGFQSPLFALLEIAILLIFIFLTIKAFRKVSFIAAFLMIPYLLWVSFATFLNIAIVLLN